MRAIIQAILSVVTAAVMLTAAVDAAEQKQIQQREQIQQRSQERAGKREVIPGSELMTSGEREDYRRRHAAAKTDEERDKVRAEHVKAMEERARLRGLRLAQPVAPKGGGK